MEVPVAAPQRRAEPPAEVPVSFANPVALRIAFMLAMGLMFLQNVPYLNLLFLPWWIVAGWVAVLWYRRLTGVPLSLRSGARLGAITGIITSAAITIEFAFASKQIFEQAAAQDARLTPLLSDPLLRGVVFAVTLGFIFALVTAMCAAGGALGARSLRKRSRASL